MKKFIYVAIAIALAGCDIQSREEVIRARMVGGEQLEQNLERWKDAFRVAASTGRIALSGPVSELQAIRRELNTLEVSDCLNEPKQKLYLGYDTAIEMFLGHMQDKPVKEEDFYIISSSFEDFSAGAALCKITPEEAHQEIMAREIAEAEAREAKAAAEMGKFGDEQSKERIRRIIEENRKKNPL